MKKLWNKNYILLLQGNTVSTLGDLMYSVAIGYWVYEQTGSSALMGIMSSISMFVTMFLSPFCGSIVDKCNRKWVMVGMDLLQSAVMISVGVLVYFGRLSTTGVLIAAFLAALGSVFYSPAISTIMIDIIPHDDMVRGQSIFSGTNSLVSLVGSALSGALVAFFGVPVMVIFNGLSNLYSAITEIFITAPKTVQQGNKVTVRGLLSDSRTAVKTIFSEPSLRLFVPFALTLNLLAAGCLTLVLPFCMEKGFSVDRYGYIMAIWTAASLICVLMLGAIKFKPKSRYLILAISFPASGLFLASAYLSNSFWLTCVFIFLGAFLNCAGNTIFNASLMLALPEENRGAILGFIQSACVGGSALSTVIYGFIGEIVPLYIAFTVGTLISLVPMFYMCFNKVTREFIVNNKKMG